MAIEIEAKLAVESFDAVLEKLAAFGAGARGELIQRDRYFDSPRGEMAKSDMALRLREQTQTGNKRNILSYKGPRQAGRFKQREEFQFGVDNADAATAFLTAMGYSMSLVIEKRRQVWQMDDCEVALDELPVLGKFVEIEGPVEEAVAVVQMKLGLLGYEHIRKGYAALMRDYCNARGLEQREFLF